MKKSDKTVSSAENRQTEKGKNIGKIIAIAAIAIAARTLMSLMLMIPLLGLLVVGSVLAKPVTYDDLSAAEYSSMMAGEGEFEEIGGFWDMNDCGIWPESIDETVTGGTVEDMSMTYYNPWDAQYLGYLVINYEDEAYKKEIERLSGIGIEDYVGNYSVTGFTKYELAAMHADDYQGFVYALTDGKSRIIYVDIIFCNYFMDLEYDKYMPEEYFPDGFDATLDNPYEAEMMGELPAA